MKSAACSLFTASYSIHVLQPRFNITVRYIPYPSSNYPSPCRAPPSFRNCVISPGCKQHKHPHDADQLLSTVTVPDFGAKKITPALLHGEQLWHFAQRSYTCRHVPRRAASDIEHPSDARMDLRPRQGFRPGASSHHTGDRQETRNPGPRRPW